MVRWALRSFLLGVVTQIALWGCVLACGWTCWFWLLRPGVHLLWIFRLDFCGCESLFLSVNSWGWNYCRLVSVHLLTLEETANSFRRTCSPHARQQERAAQTLILMPRDGVSFFFFF